MRENTNQKNSEYGHFPRSDMYLRASQTSITELFKKLVNGYKPLTIFQKKLHHWSLKGSCKLYYMSPFPKSLSIWENKKDKNPYCIQQRSEIFIVHNIIIDKTCDIIFTYAFVFLSSIERKVSVDVVGLKGNDHS